LTLPTPGKADVVVTILTDPDGYEICFVEEEGFYQLAIPTYDVVDFVYRASRGGDGAPLPTVEKLEKPHDTPIIYLDEVLSEGDRTFEEFLFYHDTHFKEEESILKGKKNWIVLYFNASWCKKCTTIISPFISNFAVREQSSVVVYSIDVDLFENIAEHFLAAKVGLFFTFRFSFSYLWGQFVGASNKNSIF
jgi:thiol-disulfide isomerase/thioredoxin